MVELSTSKRVVFPRGGQKDFFDKALQKVSIQRIAEICGLSEKTIRDWRREKFLISFSALNRLCQRLDIPTPSNIELKDKYWYVAEGASRGGKATWEKYGKIGSDPEYRKQRWREWWRREGKYKQVSIIVSKSIREPGYSKELAEFVGILLGDGGISNYQISITLCLKDEKNYSSFVKRLIEKLFNVPVAVSERKKYSTIDLIISRVNLVKFCVGKLGLKKGNKVKQQVDIPQWIKNSSSYSIACARGLIDTDGSVFNHRYNVNGKTYSYKKLNFTSRSNPLRMSVFGILKMMGIKARLSGPYDVRIDSQNDMRKYFKIFNSNNPKHLIRYKK